MRKCVMLAIAIISCFVLFSPAFSQEWNPEQKQVWKTIETEWKYLAEENKEKFLECFDPAFKGFVDWRVLPLDKENLAKWIEYMNKTTDISIYTIEPVAITIHDNVAVVQYYCDLSLALPSGQQIRQSYRYTDFLKKENNKWIIIGAHKDKME